MAGSGSDRPRIITLISYWLFFSIVFTIGMIALQHDDPEAIRNMSQSLLPIPVQYTLTACGVIVLSVSAIGMLKRKNWARFLYLGWSLLSLVIGYATLPWKWVLIPGILGFLIITWCIFKPSSGRWFTSVEPSLEVPS